MAVPLGPSRCGMSPPGVDPARSLAGVLADHLPCDVVAGGRGRVAKRRSSARKSPGEVAVTLSDDLFDQLDRVALEADVPLRWPVAGLVWDTVEALAGRIGLSRNEEQSGSPVARRTGYGRSGLIRMPVSGCR